jgi:hypothetical protein
MWETNNVDLHLLQIKDLSSRINFIENNWDGTPTHSDDIDDSDLSGVRIVSESPPMLNLTNFAVVGDGTSEYFNAINLLDNYLDPYNVGSSSYTSPDFHNSFWKTTGVVEPYVIIDTLTPITVHSVTFYRPEGVNPTNVSITGRWPQQFTVYSGFRETGPWILQGSRNWADDGKTYPPTQGFSQKIIVPLTEKKTATFWKLVVSGHTPGNSSSPQISELSEAVFRGGRVTPPVVA